MDIEWFQTIGPLGKKSCFFPATVKQSRGEQELHRHVLISLCTAVVSVNVAVKGTKMTVFVTAEVPLSFESALCGGISVCPCQEKREKNCRRCQTETNTHLWAQSFNKRQLHFFPQASQQTSHRGLDNEVLSYRDILISPDIFNHLSGAVVKPQQRVRECFCVSAVPSAGICAPSSAPTAAGRTPSVAINCGEH